MDDSQGTSYHEEIKRRTLEVLEFPQVLQSLAGFTRFAPTKALALSLGPAFDDSLVRRRQEETSEARQLLDDLAPQLRVVFDEEDLAAHEVNLPWSPCDLLNRGGAADSRRKTRHLQSRERTAPYTHMSRPLVDPAIRRSR